MDLILYNGNIETMEDGIPKAEAVAVNNGIIHAVGGNEEILSLKTASTEVVNLKGKTLLPGFHDSHMHLLSMGLAEEKIVLGAVHSLEELIQVSKLHIEMHHPTSWVSGRGWNNELWPDKTLPTRYDLDRISTKIPIVLTRACNRMLVANSCAIRAANITSETPQPVKGHFDTAPDGTPLGRFWNEAQEMIWRAKPPLCTEDIKRVLRKIGTDILRFGITSVHSDDFEAVTEKDYEDLLTAFIEMDEKGELPVRIFEQCRWVDTKTAERFFDRGYHSTFQKSRFCIESLKLLTDGVLGTRSALLSQPYADMPDVSGHAEHSQKELDELTMLAHKRKTPVSIHAIGDGGLDMALNAISYAKKPVSGCNCQACRDPLPDYPPRPV